MEFVLVIFDLNRNVIAAFVVSQVCWERGANVCVTGAWDKKACVWDARVSNDRAQHTMHVSERVYCMDVSGPMMILGAADQQMTLFDLRKPEVLLEIVCLKKFYQEILYSFDPPLSANPFELQTSLKTFASQLSKQLRCIACHTDRRGFSYGTIEGRACVQYLDSENQSSNFTFKCHRDASAKHIFTVNVMKYHPMGSFMSGGADGTVSIWDHRSRQRLKVQSSSFSNN